MKLWSTQMWKAVSEGDLGGEEIRIQFGHTTDEMSVRNLFGDAECGRQNNDPKDVHILVSRTCEYVR